VDESDTAARGTAPVGCGSCGGDPRWESLVDGDEERWLAVCRCGRLQVFLPDRPELVPEDPLGTYLVGRALASAPASPPWVRLFLRSVEGPSPTRWRHVPGACDFCGASATFVMRASPRPWVMGVCTLCISCGRATAIYAHPSWPSSEAATGRTWTPPCPAVQRLRDCVFRPYAVLSEGRGGTGSHWVAAG
jgi:hypothetical protein